MKPDLLEQQNNITTPKEAIPWWKTDLGSSEIEEITESIHNRYITQGPVTEKLEELIAQRLNVPYVLCTTSGSTALLMALMACNIKPGDEVIVPALTFIATAQAPAILGADVKLVDVCPSKPVIDINKIEEAITPKTKAIIPVHLNGHGADMLKINEIAQEYNLKIIEDCAQAFMSQNPSGYLGTQSHIGVFSLGITKLITTGKGGFITTADEKLYNTIKRMRNLGSSAKGQPNAQYDMKGFNFEFNDILASIGVSQINKIDLKMKAINNLYDYYMENLKDCDFLEILQVDRKKGEFPLWTQAICKNRGSLIQNLKEENILLKPFDPCVSDSIDNLKQDYPHAQNFANNGIILPSGPDQNKEDVEHIIKTLKNYTGS